MAEQARLVGAFEQRVVEQVELPDRQIVGGPPPNVPQTNVFVRRRRAGKEPIHVCSIGNSLSRPPLIKQPTRMSSDHQILVGQDHPGGYCRVRQRNARAAGDVGRFVEHDAEPARITAHTDTDFRSVLPDPAGQDERIEPAQRGSERAQLPADAIDEQIDGLLCCGQFAGQQYPHVA